MKRTIIIIMILWQAINTCEAEMVQVPSIRVGQPMPAFSLKNVAHYRTNNVSLEDFRGKWLIIDMWGSFCAPCIKNFPMLNEMQNRLKDKIQFMLLSSNDGRDKGKDEIVYEKLRKYMNLNLPSAYDSTLHKEWNIWVVPCYIAIDPIGIVRYLETTFDERILIDLLDGRIEATADTEAPNPEFDITKFPGSENDKLVYRSILTRGNGEQAARVNFKKFINDWGPDDRKNGLYFTMQPLYRLYQLAYFAEVNEFLLAQEMKYPVPIIETKDSSLFQFDYNSKDFKGLYNYNLAVTPLKSDDLEFIKQAFQRELKNAFGFEATIEKRSMPVWRLIAKPEASSKLKTKGGPKRSEGEYIGIEWSNYSIRDLIQAIWGFHQQGIPIIDETGISHNVDIVIAGLITDFDQVVHSLQKYGLDLVKGERGMDALVIRDPIE